MKIVIIEDEQYTAQDLAKCILELRPDFQIIKFLSSVKEATAFFKSTTDYDLVFSDIQLGDGLSFDIYRTVLPVSPVIFCTAYNNYAIDAFKANGIDYVMKPVSKPSIQQAIEKYERLVKSTTQDPKMEGLLKLLKGNERSSASLLVHHKDKIIPIKIEEVALFYIQNESCRIADFEGRHFTISETLDKAEKLAGDFFFRANRQFLVNRKAIKDVSQGFSRTHNLNLVIDFKEPIIISKEKSPVFFKWLAEG